MLASRLALSEGDYRDLSQELMDKAYRLISEMKKLQVVHIFLPLESKKEPDTWILIDDLRDAFPHLIICVPKTNWTEKSMDSFTLEEGVTLLSDKAGIPYPSKGALVAPEYIDLIFVPLLAHNPQFHRIGYGQGFYDRYLARCRPDSMKVGLSFTGPVDFESESFDVPLDLVLHCNK
jgi:5-formyltetrahydrofolate cyclo-ligase